MKSSAVPDRLLLKIGAFCVLLALAGCTRSFHQSTVSGNAASGNKRASASDSALNSDEASTVPDGGAVAAAASGASADGALGAGSPVLSTASGLVVRHFKGANELEAISLAAAGSADYTVQQLQNPPRLVVDLVGHKAGATTSAKIADSALLEKVRIGGHADKTRVVLDLKSTKDLQRNVQEKDGELFVLLGSESAVTAGAAKMADASFSAPKVPANEMPANEMPAVEMKTAEATYKSEASHKSESIVAASAPNAATEAPGKDAVTNADAAIAAVASDGEVVSVRLEPRGVDNLLEVRTSEVSPYQLLRSAPSEYVLMVPHTKIADAASSTLIAPSGSGAIRTVRPTTEGDAVAVRIFADPHSILEATAQGTRIVVKKSKNLDSKTTYAQAPGTSATDAPPAGGPPAPAAGDAGAVPGSVTGPGATKSAATGDTAGTTPAAGAEGATTAASGETGELDSELNQLLGDRPRYTGRLISLDLQDTDIDNALRIIAEVSNLNIIASDDVTGKVTLRLIDVPWDQALDVILKTNGLDKVQEGNVVRIAPVEKLRQEREMLKQARDAEDELEPLRVSYRRISYARASELKPLIESVVSERGTVAYDERTNQVIVKDIARGIGDVHKLINKLDLRTPQVLLETQIVEAQRSLLRDLGTQLGFSYIESPETGNPTGKNFPNSVSIGGAGVGGTLVNFPAQAGASAINFLFESADGSKSLSATVSGLEREGRVRIVSRPSVVTTNNKSAIIKSVEKIRVKTPSGGVSVATGSGANANGSSAVATETIEVGITLEVTPQASPDYYVLLDVRAKSSNFGSRTVEGIPSEIERSANSSVLVSSGQTFAMGGIYRLIDRDGIEGTPFLKDVPFLGHFFRRSVVDNADEELLFFITPRIVEGSFDDAAMEVNP